MPHTLPDDTSDDLSGRLGGLRTSRPDDDFRAALHRRLVAAGMPPRPRGWQHVRDVLAGHPAITWPTAGVLAGVATFLVLFAASGHPARETAPAAMARLPATATPVPATDPGTSPTGDVLPTYAVPSSRVAVIKLNFAAEVAIEDVTFEVALPDGLSFWSRGHRLALRTFRWPGRLEAGDNLIPIAVRGERPGRFRVRARVETGSGVIEHELMLDVKGGAG